MLWFSEPGLLRHRNTSSSKEDSWSRNGDDAVGHTDVTNAASRDSGVDRSYCDKKPLCPPLMTTVVTDMKSPSTARPSALLLLIIEPGSEEGSPVLDTDNATTREAVEGLLGRSTLRRLEAALREGAVRQLDVSIVPTDAVPWLVGMGLPCISLSSPRDGLRDEQQADHGRKPGRPKVRDQINVPLVKQLRERGMSWEQVRQAHPPVKSPSGRTVKISTGSIRRAVSEAEQPRASA